MTKTSEGSSILFLLIHPTFPSTVSRIMHKKQKSVSKEAISSAISGKDRSFSYCLQIFSNKADPYQIRRSRNPRGISHNFQKDMAGKPRLRTGGSCRRSPEQRGYNRHCRHPVPAADRSGTRPARLAQ